ncbi:sugar kinase [candidate division WOR-1 bacterium RIFOXYA12_FULL_43_27]|uniref:Sugar kinase n=1 Tax=candidate division WOR-1 bacterium RIFOXYC2_FULL_46_14 TaxID=1802587 RepID=A0A1F4U5C5_UNCSA|nr:MAG: sugar kinase [candidate division WOR-1 bacterium RIFOXYA12_FULL_43_27]OGC20322.1 MAG: sugar kinase [candidate division WOR-1 bacterium RIFOXYB2_FULL_46_45]OGC31941.1 MAG: sugar kinase [candidate division WOR-1 bacterium RIFOXYA2_FULL_46_56]OGC40168.1 MAG: sugar kinase [candidate division WOR-1 bacterium RIFOXYC2_FULL_46_14]
MKLLIAGTSGLDTIETPFGRKENILGGSGIHASISASFFGPLSLLSIVGEDFPTTQVDFLEGRGIDTRGIKKASGKTFHWEGSYEYDMNHAHTKKTDLNTLLNFDSRLSPELKKAEYVFLANLDPDLQLMVIEQLEAPKFIAADTMNFWIESKRSSLHKLIKKVDFMLLNEGEARQFMETPNLPLAGRRILELGAKGAIIKKGEHGAVVFTPDAFFSAASYPQEELKDPTGAGDSFAGGFIGYLAQSGDLSPGNIRTAVIFGSVMASFNVEDFGPDRMRRLTHREIKKRFDEFKRFSHFDEEEKCWKNLNW